MRWIFRILATLNLTLLGIAFFYQSPGEDPAGAGLRLSFAVVYALALAAVLLIYRLVKATWLRTAMLVLLALPALSIGYGAWLSI